MARAIAFSASVPQLRTIAREYRDMPLKYVVTLLQSPWHEERLLALLIMVGQYARAGAPTRQTIHQLYLRKHVRTMPRTMLRYAIETFLNRCGGGTFPCPTAEEIGSWAKMSPVSRPPDHP